jgi:Kdo2-lipid IVA lauroyltransferase/acyltransferase
LTQKEPTIEAGDTLAAAADVNAEQFEKLSTSKRLKYFFIRAFVIAMGRCAAIAPEKLTYGACARLALVGYKRAPRFARMAREHLFIAFGNEKSPEEIEEILRRTYINYGKNLAEFLMIPHKSADWVLKKIKFNDPNGWLDAELKKGKGVVALGAHMGNIELVCAWIGINKLPMVTVVKAQREELFTKFVMETRMKWDTKMIFRAKGVRRECVKQLGLNKIVGLVGDQNAASHGVFVDYFGKKAATATGAAEIAVQTGLPVLPAFLGTRNADDTTTVHILEPITMRDTGDKEADTLFNVQTYTNVIERFVREYPTDYLWWHRRWKTRPPAE